MSQHPRPEHRAVWHRNSATHGDARQRGATSAVRVEPAQPAQARRIGWAWAVIHAAFVVLHSGCPETSSTTVPLPAAQPQLAPDAGAVKSGSGAAGGQAGKSAAGQAGSPGPATSDPEPDPGLACGPSHCAQPFNLVGNLLRDAIGFMTSLPPAVACCFDTEQGVCGTIAAGGMCEPPAKPDPACPSIDLSALSAIVGGLGSATPSGKSGCCTHNACGIDGEIFGRGCIRNEEMTKVVNELPVVGPLIVVPNAVTCVSHDAPDPDAPDAGS